MTTTSVRPDVRGLLAAAHPGPAAAVTTVVALLALDAGLGPSRTVLVVLAVLTGQLAIGWLNDLVDLPRDRTVARPDKPLVTGRTTPAVVKVALGAATVACVDLSLSLGWRSGVVHLLLGVAWGFAHDLGLKGTWFSPVSYAVAFGTLPAVVTLAAPTPTLPPWSTTAAAAALGVGAHVVNALPDLADDVRTGVRGLPHRLGERVSRPFAAVLLVAASLLAVLGPGGTPPAWVWGALAVVAVLAVVALVGRGRLPFRAAMAIALVDVVLLVAGR